MTLGGRTRVLLASVLIALATCAWFHSLVLHPGSRLAGTVPNDATGGIRGEWAAAVQHRTPLTFKHDALESAPEGVDIAAPAVIIGGAPLQTEFVWGLRGILGAVGAVNAFALLGFVLTGISMFALLDWLGCSFGGSLFGAFVFGFNPDMVEQLEAGHLALVQNWVFVVVAWTLLRSRSSRTWRSALATGAAVALSYAIFSYDGLFAALVVAAFTLVELHRLPGRRDRWRSIGLSAFALAFSLVLLAPVLIAYAKQRAEVGATVGRASRDFYTFAASPLAYLIPSPRNPLFRWSASVHPKDLTEKTLFFGYTTTVLAIVAVVLVRRRHGWFAASESRRWNATFFAVLAFVAFAMSLPPSYTVGKVGIPMPSIFVAIFTSFWRVYARFGILVGFALAALAGMAITALTLKSTRSWRAAAPAALILLAVVELLPGNLPTINTTARPAWVIWLARERPGIVATYPSTGLAGFTFAETSLWYQRLDGHPRFNSPSLGVLGTSVRPTLIRLATVDLQAPQTARILATEGGRYVIVAPNVYRKEHRIPPVLDSRSFVPLKTFPTLRIYAVEAATTDIDVALKPYAVALGRTLGLKAPKLVYGAGFGAPTTGGSSVRSLTRSGTLTFTNANGATPVILTGRARAVGRAERLSVDDSQGHLLASQTIPDRATVLRVGPFLVKGGHSALRLVVTARSSTAGTGNLETRRIFVGRLALSPVPDYRPAARGS